MTKTEIKSMIIMATMITTKAEQKIMSIVIITKNIMIITDNTNQIEMFMSKTTEKTTTSTMTTIKKITIQATKITEKIKTMTIIAITQPDIEMTVNINMV